MKRRTGFLIASAALAGLLAWMSLRPTQPPGLRAGGEGLGIGKSLER